jgi:multimeric flavodoxin WrbA
MNLVAIIGSPRVDGNTVHLVDRALEAAASLGVDTERIILGQYTVHPCQGHVDCASRSVCSRNDDGVWILERFYAADAVILATPVYYYNVTAQMKAFIDRSYYHLKRDLRSRAKRAGLIVVADNSGIEDTLYTLNQFIDWGCDIPPSGRFTVSGYAGAPGAIRRDARLVEEARELGRCLVEA